MPEPEPTGVLRFGRVVVDAAEHRLQRDGEVVVVQPLVFRTIVLLARHRDRVLTRDELFESLWPDRVVGDAALARVIKEARAALGDEAGTPRFIRTVPRVGYQWIAAPEDAGSQEPAGHQPRPERTASSPGGPRFGHRWVLPASLALLVSILAWWFIFAPRDDAPLPSLTAADAPLPDVTELAARRLQEQGRDLLRRRDRAASQRAIELFQAALANDPDLAPAMAGMAIATFLTVNVDQKTRESAHRLLQRAAEIDPEDSLTQAGLGLLAMEEPAGWADAEAHLRRALALDPDNGEALNWLATLLGSMGRIEESVALRRRALLRDPTHTGLASNLAIGLIALGRHEEAEALLAPLARDADSLRSIRYARQQLALARGRPDEAIRVTVQVLELHPDSVDIQAEAWRLLARLGIGEVMERHFDTLYPCIPPRAVAWAQLELALGMGDEAAITTAARPFLDHLDRVPPFAVDTVAAAALALGETEAAAVLLRWRIPDATAVHGEQGDVLARVDSALLAAEIARRQEDATRLRLLADRIGEVIAEAREAGHARSAWLASIDARLAAMRGDQEEALDHLDRAMDAGWWDHFAMMNDPTWETLRQQESAAPAFRSARTRVGELRARVLDSTWFPDGARWPVACES